MRARGDRCRFRLAFALGTAVTLGALGVSAASAQNTRTALNAMPGVSQASTQAKPRQAAHTRQTKATAPKRHVAKSNPKVAKNTNAGRYYVDFRARSAASYGHAFIWYGKEGDPEVEVAGLHPATNSVIPYMIGHLIPVPSETGPSYGDLDEDYLTASYRVYLTDEQAQKVFAYIKHIQASSPFWWAPAVNCVEFISRVATYMGLDTPLVPLLFPEIWVNRLHELNGKNPKVHIADSTAANYN